MCIFCTLLTEGLTTMGYWHISIQGMGSHHNKDHPKDANLMAEKFVEDLRAAGHEVYAATFTHGARTDLKRRSEYPAAFG